MWCSKANSFTFQTSIFISFPFAQIKPELKTHPYCRQSEPLTLAGYIYRPFSPVPLIEPLHVYINKDWEQEESVFTALRRSAPLKKASEQPKCLLPGGTPLAVHNCSWGWQRRWVVGMVDLVGQTVLGLI